MTDDELPSILLNSRNADGGWPSRRGRSWTEPTALALLALQGEQIPSETRAVTAAWLAKRQLADGGWPPCAEVSTSTCVTSLAVLALGQEKEHSGGCGAGTEWLSSHIYPEMNPLQRLLKETIGVSPSQAPGSSPWFPGTAGWVIPTAYSILALSCWTGRLRNPNHEASIRRAQTYLLSRRCADGGWNHGGSPQRSESAPSYAETTGLALLALANHPSPSLEPSLSLAQQFVDHPDSTEGLCWLLIGLNAHGRNRQTNPQWKTKPRTTQEIALRLITNQTLKCRNPFLQPAA